jgi:Flp pilus assembly protein protease CpaA
MNLQTYQLMGIAYFIAKALWPMLLFFLLTVIKAIGSGDVKLLSAMATVVGASDVIDTFIYSVMLAGVISIILCIKEGNIVKKKLHYSYYITAAFFLLQYK